MWRKRKHGSRFRYDADRARPSGIRGVALPGVGVVDTGEDLSWLVDRLADGRARIVGATVREQAGRWWVSFQLDIDRTEVNDRRTVDPGAPACGIDLGLKTFAVTADDTGAVEEVQSPRALKVDQGHTLSDRVWTCLCGADHDRDVNAARNLLTAMYAST